MLYFFNSPPPPLHILFRFYFCPKIKSLLCLKTNVSFPVCFRERKPCSIHVVKIISVSRRYVNSLMTHHYLIISELYSQDQFSNNTNKPQHLTLAKC